jgi:hypothetical protein
VRRNQWAVGGPPCSDFYAQDDQANRQTALTRIQEERPEDSSSTPGALNFPSTWPPPAVWLSAQQYRRLPHRRNCTFGAGEEGLEW